MIAQTTGEVWFPHQVRDDSGLAFLRFDAASSLDRAMTDNDKERGCTRKDAPSSFLCRR